MEITPDRVPAPPAVGPIGWFERQVTLWSARAILSTGAWRSPAEVCCREWTHVDFGLSKLEGRQVTPEFVRQVIQKQLHELENRAPDPPADCVLNNLTILRDAVGLDEVETDILALAVGAALEDGLAEVLERFKRTTRTRIASTVAAVLNRCVASVLSGLKPSSLLFKSGLLRLKSPSEGHHYNGYSPFEVPPALLEALLNDHDSESEFMRCFCQPAKPTQLSVEDFPHLEGDVCLISELLSGAFQRRERGVNVLLYGPTGTGKTTLTCALASAIGAVLVEVGTDDSSGEAVSGSDRLMSYMTSQRLLRHRSDHLVLFDEIEDVFPVRPSDDESKPKKGWILRCLEDNPVPTIWISNEVSQIDPAVLRRFHMAVEVAVPPPLVRRRLLDRYMRATSVSSGWLDKMSRASLAPADIERCARVAGCTRAATPEQLEQHIEHALRGSLQARGLELDLEPPHTSVPFELANINADMDLAWLVDSLRRQPRGRILLTGAAGTGKKAFARHTAIRLGLEYVSVHASDLLNRLVERAADQVRAHFHRAMRSGAILVIDEVDRLFRELTFNSQDWEVSRANQLLAEMRHFAGLLVASTTRPSDIDPLARRRFDLTVRFRCPTANQRWELFQSVAGPCGDQRVREALDSLSGLTIDHFDAVFRRHRLLGQIAEPGALVESLRAELRLDGTTEVSGFKVLEEPTYSYATAIRPTSSAISRRRSNGSSTRMPEP